MSCVSFFGFNFSSLLLGNSSLRLSLHPPATENKYSKSMAKHFFRLNRNGVLCRYWTDCYSGNCCRVYDAQFATLRTGAILGFGGRARSNRDLN